MSDYPLTPPLPSPAPAAPSQVAHPARAVLRTIIASAVGLLVTLAAKAGFDFAALADGVTETVTAGVWTAATGFAQWVLTRPGVEAFLKRFAPGLAAVPRA